MFKKILIANRGEIAVRIIRACREMGIIPVAVFSDVDRKALHVRLAEEAYPLGEARPSESYLHIEKLISIAKMSKSEALHPGYGFLAENPGMVRRCEKEGIIFIGPSSKSMELMGKKIESRIKMQKAGVPVIPGMFKSIRTEKDLLESARKVGYPLLLKASAGGGGKGLRLVERKDDLRSSFRLVRSEAKSSFNDSTVYLEKYVKEPHHIEVQILADNAGHIVFLGERECSIQRRYQKILEETPSPFLDEPTREKLGEIAVRVAAAVGYKNAGTVEFVVDKDKNVYFLEMNTRLQVEHPITEMVTGIDLVKCQIEIAAGLPLRYSQEDIRPKGYSIECRIYAEDPDNGFMPSPGTIKLLQTPSGGFGVRDDSGIYQGYTVPLEYDPLLSKLITFGNTREEAIRRMLRALSEYRLVGIKTTIPFFKKILLNPDFYKGLYNTHFISSLEKETEDVCKDVTIAALIAAGIKSYSEKRSDRPAGSLRIKNPWKHYGRMRQLTEKL